MNATIIATGEGWAFWQIGSEVYRAAVGAGLDVNGYPMAKRWECSRTTWDAFREVFGWAVDAGQSAGMACTDTRERGVR